MAMIQCHFHSNQHFVWGTLNFSITLVLDEVILYRDKIDPPEQALLKGREHLARSKGGNETSQDKTLQSHREEEDNFTTNLGLNLLKMHVHPLHLVV